MLLLGVLIIDVDDDTVREVTLAMLPCDTSENVWEVMRRRGSGCRGGGLSSAMTCVYSFGVQMLADKHYVAASMGFGRCCTAC